MSNCGVDEKAENELVWRKRERRKEELDVGVEAVRMSVHADSGSQRAYAKNLEFTM